MMTLLDAKLTEARSRYAEALPGKLADLGEALRDAPSDVTARELATLLAHRLRGTAAAYGFPAIGEAAGRVEEAFDGLPARFDVADAALAEAMRLTEH